MLKSLDLRGKVVMGNALLTQRRLSTQIVDAGGDCEAPRAKSEYALCFAQFTTKLDIRNISSEQ